VAALARFFAHEHGALDTGAVSRHGKIGGRARRSRRFACRVGAQVQRPTGRRAVDFARAGDVDAAHGPWAKHELNRRAGKEHVDGIAGLGAAGGAAG